MSQEQDIYLPVAAGFGARREDIWRAYEVEKAVRAAWALTLLSEYRLVQLKKYGVTAKRVELKPVEVEVNSTMDDELLADLFLLYLWRKWQKTETKLIVEKNVEELKNKGNHAEAYSLEVKLRDFLAKIRDQQYSIYKIAYMYLEKGEKLFNEYGFYDCANAFEALGVSTKSGVENCKELFIKSGYRLKNLGSEDSKKKVYEIFKNLHESDAAGYTEWAEMLWSRSFPDVVRLADKLDQLLGMKSRMLRMPIYKVEAVGELEVPSYEEVEREAGELLKRLAHLGGKLEHVLSSLAVNGYRKGVTDGIEGLGEPEKAYLEELLDTPFRRVALILAYGKIGSLKRIIQRLNREAFLCKTSVPVAYLESRVDLKKVFG